MNTITIEGENMSIAAQRFDNGDFTENNFYGIYPSPEEDAEKISIQSFPGDLNGAESLVILFDLGSVSGSDLRIFLYDKADAGNAENLFIKSKYTLLDVTLKGERLFKPHVLAVKNQGINTGWLVYLTKSQQFTEKMKENVMIKDLSHTGSADQYSYVDYDSSKNAILYKK